MAVSTPLEKARRDPESMKARILKIARQLFGEYGYHGTTTRMIAQRVGITFPPCIIIGVKKVICMRPWSWISTRTCGTNWWPWKK